MQKKKFIYAGPAGEVMHTAVIHAEEPVTSKLAVKPNDGTVKPKKARKPIVCLKIVAVTG